MSYLRIKPAANNEKRMGNHKGEELLARIIPVPVASKMDMGIPNELAAPVNVLAGGLV